MAWHQCRAAAPLTLQHSTASEVVCEAAIAVSVAYACQSGSSSRVRLLHYLLNDHGSLRSCVLRLP